MTSKTGGETVRAGERGAEGLRELAELSARLLREAAHLRLDQVRLPTRKAFQPRKK